MNKLPARFELVTGPAFLTKCRRCRKRLWAGDGYQVYADLNGVAFKDYYCRPCAMIGPVKSRRK